MPKYILDPLAENDLLSIWRFIARDNPGAASRVLDAAYETCAVLSGSPGIGKPFALRSRPKADIRCWPVAGFKKYLLFYRPTSDGIQILRVYHVARNREALFDE